MYESSSLNYDPQTFRLPRRAIPTHSTDFLICALLVLLVFVLSVLSIYVSWLSVLDVHVTSNRWTVNEEYNTF